jgi:hypothetical protein
MVRCHRQFCEPGRSTNNVLVKRRVRSTRPVEAAGRNGLERPVMFRRRHKFLFHISLYEVQMKDRN